MDWGDTLTKVGVGACLGFGIITLIKLAFKKNKHDEPADKNGEDNNS